jgi:hypothetical protein
VVVHALGGIALRHGNAMDLQKAAGIAHGDRRG